MTEKGVVVGGLSKAQKFVALPFYAKQFKKKLGFIPFPGTLNLRVEPKVKRELKKLKKENGIRIAGRGGKGGAWCVPVKVNGLPCFAISPDKSTHGKNVIEILSRFNLRKKLRLKNGCSVRLAL